jgi:ABC-type sugar transport system permease subunit
MKLIFPVLIITIGFLLYPLINGIVLSFYDARLGTTAMRFVGLANYYQLSTQTTFIAALRNSFAWVVLVVGTSFAIAFSVALLLARNFPGRGICRGLVVVPWVVPNVVAALSWRWIFEEKYGILNYILASLGLISRPINWLGDPFWAFIAAIIVGIWKATPVMTVILLAGLQSLSRELFEAASIDGANALQKFWYITLPQMRSTILILITLETIWNFNTFDIIWVLTRGGPANATHVLATLTYQQAFQLFNLGSAASIGVVMFVILLLMTFVYFKLLKREV